MTLWRKHIDSPLGTLRAYASDRGLRALVYQGAELSRNGVKGDVEDAPEHPALCALAEQLAQYFTWQRQVFDLPLDPFGTPFQQRVWQALQAIPFGETRSYGEQARAIGKPSAVRAVGAANGRNPLSIVIPCHRVIGANGKLTGYAGGLRLKRALLEHEGAFRAPAEQLQLAVHAAVLRDNPAEYAPGDSDR